MRAAAISHTHFTQSRQHLHTEGQEKARLGTRAGSCGVECCRLPLEERKHLHDQEKDDRGRDPVDS